MSKEVEILDQLFELIQQRKGAADEGESWTRTLLASGTPRVAQKVGEEAVEVVVAALAESEEAFVNESADLLYHWLVLCSALDVAPAKVYQVLHARMKNGKK